MNSPTILAIYSHACMLFKRFFLHTPIVLLGLSIICFPSKASDRYFLCGPDEDGCPDDMPQYCACIPYDDIHAKGPYCLDFDFLTCTPLFRAPSCHPTAIYKNQGECLATIFQSEPEPPCPITTHARCLEGHSAFCPPDGQPDKCVS